MIIIRGLTEAVGWLSAPLSVAWQTAEPFLIVAYLAALLVLSLWIWRQRQNGARILASAVLVLLMGEAFRLIPRLIVAVTPRVEQPDAAGLGGIVSVLATAGFFLMLEMYRQQRYGKAVTEKGARAESAVYILFGAVAAVCFVRYNEWISGNSPLFWMALRSILLASMGVLTAVLWAGAVREDDSLRHLPLALALMMACYLPAAALGNLVPEISILMIPRTLALIWALWIVRGTAVLRGTGYTFRTYIKRYWTLYLLLLLPIAFFVIFRYYPMSYISLAFKKNDILRHPWQVELSNNGGMEWFINAFKPGSGFLPALGNTIMLNLLDLVIGMPMPIIMALLLNELAFPRYKRITQTVMYLPHFLSWVIISGISLRLFATTDGLINKLLGTEIKFMEEDSSWRAMYIILGIWKECGWNTIIYLAALTGINAELYEAAEVDGAGRLKKIWHVTLPGIRSTIIVLLIMNLGRILGSEFDRPYTLRNPQVGEAYRTISVFVYERGIKGVPPEYALSTAVGLFQSVVCVVFLIGANTLAKKFGERGIW